MIFSESAEEVLEALWTEMENKPTDCVKLSKLRAMPDTKTLKELLDNGILEHCAPDEIKITKNGLAYARDAVRRHRLAERLLTDVLAVKSSLIHDTACKFEHHLHRGIDENVCTLLGHPRSCPHGRPIPMGKCCEDMAKTYAPAVSTLAGIRPGEGGRVAYLHTRDPKRAQMLISMGVVPGTEIRLLAGFPSYLFQLGEGQFAVDSTLASEIYVRVSK